ncbi:hypothetical protein M409DRAFT_67675 [Zasmidium cellare ATCC 36951]|uniref:Histidine kinase n=1 Tax=Zasmidium cellare ATCC 36951 TaxID=1080233 RepID=A0A6A6CCT3_ZASCE|nr:uncharacterized protein M409DRAFT_67675 [Zasmidium cellare ATCC 36951]KAF2165007.1 hypothetical protein M409DRAFT_67675 [Zasmidium cellare ATCC 36951]
MDERLGSSLLDLPLELRALADFLSVDNSPTTILRVPAHESEQCETVYCNEAFQTLPSPEKELEDLQGALKRTLALDRDLHNRHLSGARWQTRVSKNYCIATAVVGRAHIIDQRPFELNAQGVKVHSNGYSNGDVPSKQNGHVNGDALDSEYEPSKRCLDWTRSDTPSVSPWTDFVRSVDWASTAVGPMDSWPMQLRQYVMAIMVNPNPRILVWGDHWVFFYNEACVQLFGKKHPECMGQHTSVAFSEAWPEIEPLIGTAYRGETLKVERALMSIERNGFLEETYWDFTLLPVLSLDGHAMGALDEITEVTTSVTGERRRNAVSSLTEYIETASTLPQLWSAVLESLGSSSVDIPFAMLYAVVDDVPETNETESISTESQSNAPHKKTVLAGTVGLGSDHQDAVETFALLEHIETGPGLVSSCLQAWKGGRPIMVSTEDGTLPESLATGVPGRGFGDSLRKAIISPIKSTTTGGEVLAILVTGLCPRAPINAEYKLYLQITIEFIEKAAALISLPEEYRRTQKISDDINNALAQQLKLTTLKAERSEAKFSRLAATSPTGMFLLDSEGRALYVNDTYLDMLGLPPDDSVVKRPEGSAWKEQVHEEDLDRFIETWDVLKEQKVPITIEYRSKKPWKSTDKSGQEMSGESWLLATAFPEIEADGSVSTIQGWLTDISHRKFSEQLLSQRLEDALENKRQTENFIDMTSHELRNPLSAILQSADSIVSTLDAAGPGSSLRDEEISLSARTVEEIVDAAQTIILCAQHQKRIVDDILTLSKLDASLLVISPEKVQPPMLVTKALKMYEAEIARAGIDAQLCIEPSYEELGVDWVILDPSRLLQVVINLLTNSIKFTQYSTERRIKVCLGASYQAPSGKHHGISFVPVRHARHARTPAIEWGEGEDIYLQIAVYDTGRGLSEDEMKVLFQRFSQASPKTYKQYGGSGLGLFISRELCELQGGQIGVASEKGKRTVFTFYVKAKRWIPDSPRMARRPPVTRFASTSASPVAFSRRGSAVLQNVSNQMGHETKESEAICEVFEPQSDQSSTAQQLKVPTPTTNGAHKTEMHVLIVEDNLVNQKVMSQQLRRAGCVVHVANHGGECLDFLEKSTFCSSDTMLHVILLDLEMPTMDGLTCVKHIRERQLSGKITGHVPVIAVTANARNEQISIAIDAGMDQVVTKPFRIPELVPQMEALVAEVAWAKQNLT